MPGANYLFKFIPLTNQNLPVKYLKLPQIRWDAVRNCVVPGTVSNLFIHFTSGFMNQNTRLAIIGGTGKSGKYLVKQLLGQGFRLRLLIRNPQDFQLKNHLIEIIRGDARRYESVKHLMDGCQAVISMLGQPKGEPSIFSQASKNVIRAMNHFGIDRYIVTTGLNVDAPSDKKGIKTKLATDWMRVNFPETTADKQVEFNVLSSSNVSWTMVRLPLIEQTDERSRILVSLENCPGEKVNSTDLASFVIEQISDTKYVRKAPFIASV
jgi:putative NADH-flavin reductase